MLPLTSEYSMDLMTDFLNRLLIGQNGELGLTQAVSAFFVAYIGGVLSSLTPCVYPMIPITVSVVGGMGTGHRTWRKILVRGLVYVSGMTAVYSFLGVLAGLTGKVFGSMTNTAGWYASLGIVMTLAALVMLDVIPFEPMVHWERMKSFLRKLGPAHRNRSSASLPVRDREMTVLGAFVLGASSGFIAAPCTTPVLAVILAYIAKTQSVGLGLALMFAFSVGLGTLLLVIAAFTGALQVLPRAGKWMKTIKTASGLLLLLFADYLIYRAGKFGGF
ncbi:MAG TPA: hypothetical protein DIS93_09925 [Bdellovibrionales bacterium]|nr:hypothetical protein [Bdellovibrionales bacterium]